MVTKKRGLGKGLDALLSAGKPFEQDSPVAGEQLRELPIDLIQRGQFQPRSGFDQQSIEELSNSIKAQGVVQPIVVRFLPSTGRYEIIAGERRWRAAQLAGLQEIPAVVRDIQDQQALCIALIENIQREDLNPLEEARALNRLLKEFNLTHEAVAEAVGRSRSSVTNLLRLLDLDNAVKALLEQGKLEMGHARALLSLPTSQQIDVANRIIKKDLSVRATENLVKSMQAETGKDKKTGNRPDPNIVKLQDNLSEKLGTHVDLRHKANGKGTIMIKYNSLDELDGILARIK